MTQAEADAVNEQLRQSYHAMFRSPLAQLVMADLAAFCHARKTTFDPDDRVHARNEGRRDVFMRISEFTNLSLEEIYRIRGK